MIAASMRNADPYMFGLEDVYDRALAVDIKGSDDYGTLRSMTPQAQKAIAWLYAHGETGAQNLARHVGLKTDELKYQLTTYPVYESDDGRWLGILDENGEPVRGDGLEPEAIAPKSRSTVKKKAVIVERDGVRRYKSVKEAIEGEEWLTKMTAWKKLHGMESKIRGEVRFEYSD